MGSLSTPCATGAGCSAALCGTKGLILAWKARGVCILQSYSQCPLVDDFSTPVLSCSQHLCVWTTRPSLVKRSLNRAAPWLTSHAGAEPTCPYQECKVASPRKRTHNKQQANFIISTWGSLPSCLHEAATGQHGLIVHTHNLRFLRDDTRQPKLRGGADGFMEHTAQGSDSAREQTHRKPICVRRPL